MTDTCITKRQKFEGGGAPFERLSFKCAVCDKYLAIDHLQQCFFCKRECGKECAYTKDKEETRLPWNFKLMLFLLRLKEVSSPFYKDNLPLDLFKLILLQVRLSMCTRCAQICPHIRRKFPPLTLGHPYNEFGIKCTECGTNCCDGCLGACVPMCNIIDLGSGARDFSRIKSSYSLCRDCSKEMRVCSECYCIQKRDFMRLLPCTKSMQDCKGHFICMTCDSICKTTLGGVNSVQ